jgi:hypothetical protein
MAAFIDDGYTREQLLPATTERPAVHFEYRPMLAAERRRLSRQTVRLGACGPGGAEAAASLAIAALAARLVSWDVMDDEGRPLEISAETIAALEPGLFEQVYSAVTHFDDEEATAKN